MKFENGAIVLVDNCNKKDFIIKMSKEKLINIKVMTFDEIKQKLLFTYDERAIYEIMKNENVTYNIALKYLENMYFIHDIKSPKVIKLLKIKKMLEKNNLLKENKLFKNNIVNCKIYIYNIPYLNKEQSHILKNLNYEIITEKQLDLEYKAYELPTLEDEVIFIANKIVSLLKSGVSLDKIKLINLNDEYRLMVHKIFKIFNIPTNIRPNISLFSTAICQKYLESGLEGLKNFIKNSFDENIFNAIVDICNKYVWCQDEKLKKEMIIQNLKTASLIQEEIKGVCETNLETINNDDYLFILGFNQGSIPVIYKNEDYLSDEEKERLNLSTSLDKNILGKNLTLYYLSTKCHLTISYKLRSLTEDFYKSSLLDELNAEIIKPECEYCHSHLFNQITLSSKLDDYYKYGIKDEILSYLYYNYPNLVYKTYNNKYKRISLDKINKFFQERLLLSYTSLDAYYKCSFRYYLQYVLKIGKYEETFIQNIGNIYHYMLSVAFKSDFIFEIEWNRYLEENHIITNKKEEFFMNKIKEEVKFTIDEIKRQEQQSNFKEKLLETKFYLQPTGKDNEVFMGIIDKLVYMKLSDKYLAAIIDYKTGNPNLNLTYLPYGLDMQLPIYVYLVNKSDKLKPLQIVGFYLQKLIHSAVNYNSKLSYLDQKKKNLMLQGYSLNDEELLSEFDYSYKNSNVIKSMKVGKNGFYAYSKVLSNEEINKISEIVEDKIIKAISLIKIGEFDINPKRIGLENVSCAYCPFKDICYHTEADIKILKEYRDLDFLRGDKDAKMD